MSNQTKIELNIGGIRELRNDEGVVNFLKDEARKVANKNDFQGNVTINSYNGANRSNASIYIQNMGYKEYFHNKKLKIKL